MHHRTRDGRSVPVPDQNKLEAKLSAESYKRRYRIRAGRGLKGSERSDLITEIRSAL